MLFIETLLKKRYFTKPNGDTIIDLTFSSLDGNAQSPVEVNVITVSEDFAMRPDLVAKTVYGDDGKFDYLLKYNGISNPFSIEGGDVLMVPEPFKMGEAFRMPDADDQSEYSTKPANFKYVDRNGSTGNKRLDMLMAKAENKKKLPPNVNQPGDSNIKYKNGKIVFGEDVTTISKENCPETLTRARVKAKIMNSQIFK